MWKKIIVLIGTTRFLLPFFLFSYPIIVIIFSVLLDTLDGHIAFWAGWRWRNYNTYDKLLDWWWYVWVLLFCLQTPIFGVMGILFLFRSIGQFLALISSNPKYFVWFPNIFEKYFLLFFGSWFITPPAALFSGWYQVIPLTASIILAIWFEYIAHIDKKNVGAKLFHLPIDWKKNN